MIQVTEIKHLGNSEKWITEPDEFLKHMTANVRHKIESKEIGNVVLMVCLDCAISWETEIGV
jgi:hypothetical protein